MGFDTNRHPLTDCGNLVFVAFAKTFLPRGFIETENLACSLSLLPLLQFPEKRAYCSKIKPIVVVTFGWRGPIVLSVPRLSITGIPYCCGVAYSLILGR